MRAASELESGKLRLTIDGTKKIEQIDGRTTYDHQLEAFVSAVLDGEEQSTGGQDAIANMRAIDAIYRAEGFLDQSAQTMTSKL